VPIFAEDGTHSEKMPENGKKWRFWGENGRSPPEFTPHLMRGGDDNADISFNKKHPCFR